MATNLRNITADMIAAVTDAQLALTHRAVDEITGEVFYQVESETDALAAYTVRYSAKHGITCTCKSGQRAFSNAKAGVCKHGIWSVAHAQAYKAEQSAKAIAQKVARLEAMGLTYEEAQEAASAKLIINGQPATDEELVRVFGPRQRRPSELEMEMIASGCGYRR